MTPTKPEPPNFKTILFNYIEAMPALIQIEIQKARLTRTKYEALVANGFTEAQALELSKTL